MKLLENELILRYFGCRKHCKHFTSGNNSVDECMSYRILRAMCEPIKKGERLLNVDTDNIYEYESANDWEKAHYGILRLPDQFQKRECCEYEKYLKMTADGTIATLCPKHFELIRNAVQKPDPCTHNYGVFGVGCMPWCKGKHDPVVELGMALGKQGPSNCWEPNGKWYVQKLREIVELARAKA